MALSIINPESWNNKNNLLKETYFHILNYVVSLKIGKIYNSTIEEEITIENYDFYYY